MKFKANQQLITKCPERMGNVTILKAYQIGEKNLYMVLTDYGNIVNPLTEEEMDTQFYKPEWEGVDETLQEKIQARILKLQFALDILRYTEGVGDE